MSKRIDFVAGIGNRVFTVSPVCDGATIFALNLQRQQMQQRQLLYRIEQDDMRFIDAIIADYMNVATEVSDAAAGSSAIELGTQNVEGEVRPRRVVH